MTEPYSDKSTAGPGGEPEAQYAPRGYSIIRRIGQGTMASVYLARDDRLKRLAAIKVLNPELAKDDIGCRRFEREGHAAARISHPNVCQIYTVGRLANGVPYICMEYIAGRNLADLATSEGPCDVESARHILAQLAAALEASHAHDVIHRDVKPANVLVESDTGRVVLTDFGIAGIRESGSEMVTQLTRLGEQLGDPRYMSPEQHRGEVATVETDTYNLGVVAYEMLTGGDPFGLDPNQDIAAAHLRREPLDLHMVRPDVPEQLAGVLRRCLSKRPEHRPELSTIISALEGDEAVDPGENPPQNVVSLFVRELQRRRVYQAAAAYLAAMIVILQALDVILPATPLPDWVYVVFVAIFLGGFPIALVLAWLYDVRAGGIERTVSTASAIRPWILWLLQGFGLVLSVIIAGLIGWWMFS